MVASSEFQEATAVQARALGVEPVTVFVTHPIQDRTDDEMREIADNAAHGILSALTSP